MRAMKIALIVTGAISGALLAAVIILAFML